MPVSKKQLRANRQNAQKNTGPKSVEGKAIASRNAIKHGMYSRDLIIESANLTESREEFEQLHNSLIYELQPQTVFQEYLVAKIANCLWRSRRAIRAETAVVTRQLDHIDRDLELRNRFLGVARQVDDDDDGEYEMTPEEEEHFRAVEIGRQSIPNEKFAVNILRYEMRLDRQLTRAYKLLCQLQDRQNRDQTESDGPIEIPVPVYRCPAVYGDECVQHRPAPDTALSQTPPSPRPPLPQGEGPGERDDGWPGRSSGSQGEKRMPHPPHGPVTTAEEGFERPTIDMPTDDPESMENHDQATSDAVESCVSEARHRGPGGGRSTHENTKNDKPNPSPRNRKGGTQVHRKMAGFMEVNQ